MTRREARDARAFDFNPGRSRLQVAGREVHGADETI